MAPLVSAAVADRPMKAPTSLSHSPRWRLLRRGSGGAALAALAAQLQHDLDPEHHDRDGRADDADREGREERHLLERVLRHSGADEPDGEHGSDDPDHDATVLHTLRLA